MWVCQGGLQQFLHLIAFRPGSGQCEFAGAAYSSARIWWFFNWSFWQREFARAACSSSYSMVIFQPKFGQRKFARMACSISHLMFIFSPKFRQCELATATHSWIDSRLVVDFIKVRTMWVCQVVCSFVGVMAISIRIWTMWICHTACSSSHLVSRHLVLRLFARTHRCFWVKTRSSAMVSDHCRKKRLAYVISISMSCAWMSS